MSFSAILGQERALRALKALLSTRRIPPGLLFHGPEGVGKTAAALAFAKALNCEAGGEDACGGCPPCRDAATGADPHIQRLNAAYQAALRGEDEAKQRSLRVDTVRHLLKELELRSLKGRWKVAIVEDAHTLVDDAANCMLKALEEPPPRTAWILLTHQRERLLPTVLSRCQKVPFARLPAEMIASALRGRGASKEAASELARQAEGSLGRALALQEERAWEPLPLEDPLAPFRLAEGLPREAYLARPVVEGYLRRMAWQLAGPGGAADAGPKRRAAFRELARLKAALAANADPRLVLELAAFKLQELAAPR